MLKCLIINFGGFNLDKTQKKINDWLSQHPNMKIQAVSQTSRLYTIFYEE